MGKPRRDSSGITGLIAGMAVVATAFVSAISFFESSTVRVSRETKGMLASGVPSTDLLTGVRASLRDLDGALDAAVLTLLERHRVDRGAIEAARRHMDEELAAYRRLPYYDFEAGLNGELDLELSRLDAALADLMSEMTTGRLRAAHELENGEWRRQSDRVDDRLHTLIGFNIRHVTEHAVRIDQIRRESALVGFAVGGVAMGLAFVATAMAARAVRHRLHLQEERAAELEMFASRVAHDLMSPLTSVSLALEIGREQSSDPEVARMVGRALSSARRMRGIVDGLFDFARSGGQPLRDAHCDAGNVVSAVVEESRAQAERAHVELAVDRVAPVEVAVSPGILTVLLGNLINNAIKFMGDAPVRRVIVRADSRADRVRFEVEDTGPGLPAAFVAHAFEPYSRATPEMPGLGLGLATVKRLVSAYDGCVGVEEGGGGARFWFELPRAVTPAS